MFTKHRLNDPLPLSLSRSRTSVNAIFQKIFVPNLVESSGMIGTKQTGKAADSGSAECGAAALTLRMRGRRKFWLRGNFNRHRDFLDGIKDSVGKMVSLVLFNLLIRLKRKKTINIYKCLN